MGIISRLAQLIKSNLNDLISRSEDPEKMLNQVLLEMSTQLIEAKKQVANAIADEKKLAKDFETENCRAQEWERKAMVAVRAGEDDLAKEALLRQKEHTSLATEFEKQWQKQAAAVKKLKDQLRVLSGKIEEARRKKNVLVARKKRAEAQEAIHATMTNLQNNSSFETFDRMEEKINEMEARADATEELANQTTGDDLSRRFDELETNRGADLALAELKTRLGMTAPTETAPAVGVRIKTTPEEITADPEMAALEVELQKEQVRRQNERS